MPTLERTVERRETQLAPLKRVSWGALFAGTFIAIAVMILLGALGVAVGATTIDPLTGDTPSARALGIGAGIWWLASGAIALFAGGMVAGRLSGLRRRGEGPVHGLVTWAIATVVIFVLVSSLVGSLVAGGIRVIGAAAPLAAEGVEIYIPAPEETEGMAPADEQTAREVAQAASDTVASATWWTFGYLLLTAFAAGLGGLLGAPGGGRTPTTQSTMREQVAIGEERVHREKVEDVTVPE